MRERISAVIIKDKKVLLVRSFSFPFFGTPGGAIEKGESKQEALRREIKEEIGAELKSFSPYISYIAPWRDTKHKVHAFIVEVAGKVVPLSEIRDIVWYSKENFLNNDLKLAIGVEKNLIPKLIKDDLL